MRPEEPSLAGAIDRQGVRVAYEVFGPENGPVLVLLPCWIIVHARAWKVQVADFARDIRVVVIDGRGNGRSSRPTGPDAYCYGEYVADALAVIDHLGLESFVLLGFSRGGPQAALIAQARPCQVQAVVLIGAVAPVPAEQRAVNVAAFTTPKDSYEGWERYNAHAILADVKGFVRMFFSRMFVEPHSSKQIEDSISWASETSAQVLVDSLLGGMLDEVDVQGAYAAIACPALQIHGEADEIAPLAGGRRVAELTGAELYLFEGSGHGPHMRYPIRANTLIRDFLRRHGILPEARHSLRRSRAPRILYVSSPIGLGHVRRDLAVVRALRAARSEIKVDWLAQDPVTRFLTAAGERVHGASSAMASESRHIESEAGEHDLHVFQALRRMDEILVRNFRVFQNVVEADHYDLVVADEGWEIDHFWHEHPELKCTALAWLTDFVGFAPMPAGGQAEAVLSADYNAEMVRHIEGARGVRDRAIYVGAFEEIVDDALGPDLPQRRAWTAANYCASGYILGDDVPQPEQREGIRAELGFREGESVIVVSIGGSGVGAPLIRRILQALPLVQRHVPGLRAIVIAGPRVELSFLPMYGVEFRGFELQLPRLLAACDLALVQGGLSTCMELAATRTPFIYFPLEQHFEQNIHVAARLDTFGAGHRMRYRDADPDTLASVIVRALGRPVSSREVERDGAQRAASLLLPLL